MGGDQLLTALHTNLWASLRHVFNTDRVLLAVTYAIDFAGFVMLAFTTSRRPLAAGITVAALPVLDGLVMLSFIRSRRVPRPRPGPVLR